MTDTTRSSELKSRLIGLEVEPFDGETAGYVHVDRTLNLNAVAIGLGLERIRFEPDRFPGLVYQPDGVAATVVLFGDGVVAVVDAPDRATAREAIATTLDETRELGLLDAEIHPDDAMQFSDDIPSPSLDAGGASTACPSCGEPLSGGENFCPSCGTGIATECPGCGSSLSGDESYCPECGTEIAG